MTHNPDDLTLARAVARCREKSNNTNTTALISPGTMLRQQLLAASRRPSKANNVINIGHIPLRIAHFSSYKGTPPSCMPMKPGTQIKGLEFLNKDDQPIALERAEYPDWLEDLTKPATTLAALRRMDLKDATFKDMRRYLKLTRRNEIKDRNAEAGES